ncbi:CPBP family intramembrane glutamic endopeptidase [Marivirga atlantica]|uniref:CPBP family intramembrane metalloprotease n=1 Tax=Marivirga atlantica TaxID=1548457 RepID=A0A937ADP0_9BACT|nr:CPBP family intramembrane glutamic endopeptidase [Marivirga atlantica]MBL0764791.1 CPBP family intramembrane metalloprotease [Marivirga atlantica]
MKILSDFIRFSKNPNEGRSTLSRWQNIKVFSLLLLINLIVGLAVHFLLELLSSYSIIELPSHQIDRLLDDTSVTFIIVFGVILVPFLEEVIFRFPLIWRYNYIFRIINYILGSNRLKEFWKKYYSYFLYFFVLAFGFIHLTNFEDVTLIIIIISPLLVLSQIIGGLCLSYVRVRMHFLLGFIFHALFNLILLTQSIVFNTSTKVDIENTQYNLIIESKEARFGAKMNFDTIRNETNLDRITLENIYLKTAGVIFNNPKLEFNKLHQDQVINIYFESKNKNLNSDSIINHHLDQLYDQ